MKEQLYFADAALASLAVDSDQSSGFLVLTESSVVESVVVAVVVVVVVVVVVLVAPTAAAAVSSAASAAAVSSAVSVPTVAAAASELATGLHRDPVVAAGSVVRPSGRTHLSAATQFAGTAAGSQLLI